MTWALESDTIDVRPLHERVYDVLMKRMIAGTLSAGERLDAAEIAQTLGVSRTPVKEALNRLAFEGLVAIQARRGTSVSIPTKSEISELYEVMRMIGSHTVDGALLNKSPDSVDELKTLLKRWQGEADGNDIRDYSAYLERDREFHTYLVELAGKPRIAEIYRSTGLKIRLAFTLDSKHAHNIAESDAEHLEILKAFENGSAAELRAAIQRHYHTPTGLHLSADESLTAGR